MAKFLDSTFYLSRVEDAKGLSSLQLDPFGVTPKIIEASCIEEYATRQELYFLPEQYRIGDKLLYSHFKHGAHVESILVQGNHILVHQYQDLPTDF